MKRWPLTSTVCYHSVRPERAGTDEELCAPGGGTRPERAHLSVQGEVERECDLHVRNTFVFLLKRRERKQKQIKKLRKVNAKPRQISKTTEWVVDICTTVLSMGGKVNHFKRTSGINSWDLVVVIQILGRKVLDVSFGSRTAFLARNQERGERHKIVGITLTRYCWEDPK